MRKFTVKPKTRVCGSADIRTIRSLISKYNGKGGYPEDPAIDALEDNIASDSSIAEDVIDAIVDLDASGDVVSYLFGEALHNPEISRQALRKAAKHDDYHTFLIAKHPNADDALRQAFQHDYQPSKIRPEVTRKFNLEKIVPIPVDWYEWANSDDERAVRRYMEAQGYILVNTLAEACEVVHDGSIDVQDALESIDINWGNDANIFPLSLYDVEEQQAIYLQWIAKHYPDEYAAYTD